MAAVKTRSQLSDADLQQLKGFIAFIADNQQFSAGDKLMLQR